MCFNTRQLINNWLVFQAERKNVIQWHAVIIVIAAEHDTFPHAAQVIQYHTEEGNMPF